MKFSWIAVALATAIRLSAGAHAWTAAVIAALAILALILSRNLTIRVAAIFLLLVATLDATSCWRVHSLRREFPQRLAEHLQHDLTGIRRTISSLESDLDASAARIAQRIAGKESDRAALFLLVAAEARKPGRGARILDQTGEPVAWWGEDYRAPGDRTYQFDVTNLYVTRSRVAGKFTIQAFARIENVAGRLPSMHPDDSWITSMFFHGGFPRAGDGVQRFLVAKRADSTLFIDVIPRLAADVVDAMRADGASVSAILLAIGALMIVAIGGRASRPLAAVVALV
ncbi:MAG TPA: hypothetical protein VF215_15790, partial [Thermoanaerobaculia bacterium]